MCLIVVLMGFHRFVKKYKDGGGHWNGHQILTNKLTRLHVWKDYISQKPLKL